MLIFVRIAVLFLLLSGTLLFGIIPICIKPYLNACHCSNVHQKGCPTRKQRLATCFLIFFGGGVLLATCLVHLMHEARLGFEEALAKCFDNDNATEYSTEARVTLELDLKEEFTHIKQEVLESDKDYPAKETIDPPTTEYPWLRNFSITYPSVLEKAAVYDSVLCSDEIAQTLFPLPEFITVCGFFFLYFLEELIRFIIRCCQSFKTQSFQPSDNGIELTKEIYIGEGKIRKLTDDEICSSTTIVISNGAPSTARDESCATIKSSNLVGGDNDTRKISTNNINFFFGEHQMDELNIEGLEDFVTVLALSLNSVFEGFAAGFQHTEISTWMLYFSLALHKYVCAFVVSLETLHSGGSNLRACLYTALFSLMCPLGMLAAILTHQNLVESGSLQIGVLNAISVGTLLYVTFFEMLRQRKDFAEISGFSQFFVLLLGFISMSTIEYFYTRVE